jgi:hypothetical protein
MGSGTPQRGATLATVFLVLALAGCATPAADPTPDAMAPETSTPTPTPTPSPSETDPPTGEPFQVSIELEAQLQADGSLLVVATTNLPDGAELGGWLSSGDYQAQDRRYVDGGKVELGPFSDNYEPLASGTYKFSVSLSIASLQSAEVRQYIGEKGDLMTGPFVYPSDIGDEGNVVRFETTVTIP